METFTKFILVGWSVVILILVSWIAQHFYDEYKNKK